MAHSNPDAGPDFDIDAVAIEKQQGLEAAVCAPSLAKRVMGPLGFPIGLEDLPCNERVFWNPRRKAEIVCAVQGGLIAAEKVAVRYRISRDELHLWTTQFNAHGLSGLRVHPRKGSRRGSGP